MFHVQTHLRIDDFTHIRLPRHLVSDIGPSHRIPQPPHRANHVDSQSKVFFVVGCVVLRDELKSKD